MLEQTVAAADEIVIFQISQLPLPLVQLELKRVKPPLFDPNIIQDTALLCLSLSIREVLL